MAAPPVAAAVARRKGLVERTRWSSSDLGLLLTRLYSFGSTATEQASRFVAGMVSATPIDVVAEFLPALQEHDKRAVLGVFQGVELLVIVGDKYHGKAQAAELRKLLKPSEGAEEGATDEA